MKIKGEVEVFKIMQNGSSESVLKESNMVVDGAAEVIVDMLTTPYSLKNVAGSESLNPSNFTIQAVSLGKAEKLYGGHPDTSAADTDVIGMHCLFNNLNLSTQFNAVTGAYSDEYIGAQSPNSTSSYTPSYKLPKDPRPRDVSLEDSSKTQVQLYYELSAVSEYPELTQYTGLFSPSNTPSWQNASALITPNGHNVNALYSKTEAKSMESLHQGCYAPSDGIDIHIWDSTVTRKTVTDSSAPFGIINSGKFATVNDVSGRYNTVGSMDSGGYLVAYPIQDHPASGDPTQGVAVSAATTSSLTNVSYNGAGLIDGSANFIGSPAVCYNFTISSTDLLCLAAYKGVTNIGLWAFDLKETLKQEAAPVAWTTPTNNRKYKLFAKKVFSEDLTSIQDASKVGGDGGIINYVDLNIQWRINFDFGRTF